MHEVIDLHSHDLFTKMVVIPALVPTLVSTLTPDDTTYFYGFGGGADFNATKHVHLRADVEFVHVYLFSGILKDSRQRASFGRPHLQFWQERNQVVPRFHCAPKASPVPAKPFGFCMGLAFL